MMQLSYDGKRKPSDILLNGDFAEFNGELSGDITDKNLLILGENLRAMKSLLYKADLKGKIDLVYIDPPFATKTIYRHNEARTATISSSDEDAIAYADTRTGAAFLEFLRERLVLLHQLLAERGSLYLHIDYKIGHYVKVIMDEIFGPKNFRNDITRVKCNPKNFQRKGYSNVKDLILFYTKSENFTWNEPRVEMTGKDIERLFPKIDRLGRRYTTTPLHAPGETKNGNTGKEWNGLRPPKGRHWRCDPSELERLNKEGLIEWSSSGNPRKIIYAEEAEAKGKRLQDIWEFKDPQYPSYPTEKNLDLLKTIVRASSLPGQMVMDCFCGSGTTLIAAEALERRWIGIDESKIAIEACRKKLSSLKQKRELVCLEEKFEDGNETVPEQRPRLKIGEASAGYKRSRKKRTSSPRKLAGARKRK